MLCLAALFRRVQIQDVHLSEFLRKITELAPEGFIGEENPALRCGNDNQVSDGFKERVEVCFVFPDFFFRLFALGDIDQRTLDIPGFFLSHHAQHRY